MNHNKRNKLAFTAAIASGILLILSGTTGVAALSQIERIVLKYFDIELIGIIFSLLFVVASLGGFAVISGGYLIYKKQIKTGRFIISIGAGFGVLTLLANIFVAVVTMHLTVEWFLSFATIGLILAVAAKTLAKGKG